MKEKLKGESSVKRVSRKCRTLKRCKMCLGFTIQKIFMIFVELSRIARLKGFNGTLDEGHLALNKLSILPA